jgi:hypothetical protein
MPNLGTPVLKKKRRSDGPSLPPLGDPLINTWVSLGYSALAASTAVRSPRIVVLSLDDLKPLLIATHNSRRKKDHCSCHQKVFVSRC